MKALADVLPPACDAPGAPAHPARLGTLLGGLLALCILLGAPSLQQVLLAAAPGAGPPVEDDASAVHEAERRVERLEAEARAAVPGRAYLVVSTTDNRFRLLRGEAVLREGLCSTGSYIRLEGAERSWTFATPRGAFRVQKKTRNPVWTKPDWAFVEEGRPVPPLGHPDRVERGVLGAYSLSLGDGYLLHGTLYQRLLGRPVSHGCVRLGDDDLRAIFETLPVGAPVYIY